MKGKFKEGVYALSKDVEFPHSCKINYKDFSLRNKKTLRIKLKYQKEDLDKKIYLVVKINSKNDKTIYYNQTLLKEQLEFKEREFIFNLPSASSEKDQLVVYLWNSDYGELKYEGFNIELLELKDGLKFEHRLKTEMYSI
ncbi:MAG: hypothetical protein ACEPOW_05090 [Bacteroidales bacterium]